MNTSRRNFMKGATALTGAVALSGLSRNDVQAQGAALPLEGQIAIVTGAARGIGRAIALTLAREGVNIVGVDIASQIPSVPYPLATPEDLAETARLVEELGRRFVAVEGDTRDMAQMQSAVQTALDEFGQIDILAANAGINTFNTPLATITDEQLRDVIEVNLIGTANSLRAVIPHMVERQSGRIVAISSAQARNGTPTQSNYVASKWGILGLVKSAALEVAQYNVTVNAVLPGVVNAPMAMNEANYNASSPQNPTQEGFAEMMRQITPQPTPWVEPEDVANLFLYLVSPEARYVSGSGFEVSAGFGAQSGA